MEQVFLQNSQNIKSVLEVMKLQEEVLKLHQENASRIQTETTEDTDIVMDPNTYLECSYGSLICPTNTFYSVPFKASDSVIMVRQCGHTFKRDIFLNWIKNHNTCMYCSVHLY